MGINQFIEQACVQTAVYWAPTGTDEYGQKTFSDPVEISCRWEGKLQMIADPQGKEIRSNAQVFVKQDMLNEGFLFLGELDDLDSSEEEDVLEVTDAYEIKLFTKLPQLRSETIYVRVAYL